MYNLNRNDLEEILKFVNLCMTQIKTGNVDPKKLLTEMLKIFQSNDAEFFPSNQNLDGVDLSSSLSLKEGKSDQVKYVDHYWRYDPLYSAQFSTKPTNRVFKTDDVISYSQLKKLDYYRDYLQQINWFGELVIRLCSEEGFWGTISISRSAKQPYFNNTDVQKAEFLLPYLLNTFEATMFFSKINGERKAFEQWLETKPEGVILLDTKLEPVYYNNKAKQMCRPLSDVKPESLIKRQNVQIALPRSITEDCKRIADLSDSGQSFPNNRIINTKNGEKYYIRYTLINQLSQEIFLPYFIIHMNDLTKNNDETGVVLLKNYGLSEQEVKIAQYTGLGLTNKEIGQKLGISQFTVQSHLRNIFEKTGIKRRSQLANLIK